MSQCQYFKQDGTQCRHITKLNQLLCWQHQNTRQSGGADGEEQVKQTKQKSEKYGMCENLGVAVFENNLKKFKELVRQGADPFCENDTPMLIAIANGSDQIVDEILKGRDPSSIHERDEEALQLAIDLGDLNVIKSLKKLKSFELDDLDLSKVKSQKVVKTIEEWKKQRNEEKERNEQLWQASRDGDLTLVKELLKAGAEPNVTHTIKIPLVWASIRGHAEIINELLKHGADVNIHNGDSLKDASEHGHINVVRLLLAHGANTDNLVISKIKSTLIKNVKNRQFTKKIADDILDELKLAKEKAQKSKKSRK